MNMSKSVNVAGVTLSFDAYDALRAVCDTVQGVEAIVSGDLDTVREGGLQALAKIQAECLDGADDLETRLAWLEYVEALHFAAGIE